MEITGKVIFILPLRSGISKNGKEWKSQEFVIEIPGNYPRKICINIFGDKIDTFNLQRGGNYHVFFDVDAKEFNGRWYNSVTAFKVENLDGGNTQRVPQNNDGNKGAPYQAPNGEYRQNAPKSVPKPDDDLFPTKQSDNQSNQQNNSEDDLPF